MMRRNRTESKEAIKVEGGKSPRRLMSRKKGAGTRRSRPQSRDLKKPLFLRGLDEKSTLRQNNSAMSVLSAGQSSFSYYSLSSFMGLYCSGNLENIEDTESTLVVTFIYEPKLDELQLGSQNDVGIMLFEFDPNQQKFVPSFTFIESPNGSKEPDSSAFKKYDEMFVAHYYATCNRITDAQTLRDFDDTALSTGTTESLRSRAFSSPTFGSPKPTLTPPKRSPRRRSPFSRRRARSQRALKRQESCLSSMTDDEAFQGYDIREHPFYISEFEGPVSFLLSVGKLGYSTSLGSSADFTMNLRTHTDVFTAIKQIKDSPTVPRPETLTAMEQWQLFKCFLDTNESDDDMDDEPFYDL